MSGKKTGSVPLPALIPSKQVKSKGRRAQTAEIKEGILEEYRALELTKTKPFLTSCKHTECMVLYLPFSCVQYNGRHQY